ncbi:hypothetical protein DFJ77DRAFT_436481 [Powellomyces hirtus]|nr:hypothetical protein DFJ77DRAFT_436481 [Powellomyces hirtus]
MNAVTVLAGLLVLAAGSDLHHSTLAAPTASTILRWRDHHQAFVGSRGVFFVGGNVEKDWKLDLGQNGGAIKFKGDSSVHLLNSADAKVSPVPTTFPPLIGHSCAVHEASQVAYCTGGFHGDKLQSPMRAENEFWRYDTRTDTVTNGTVGQFVPRAFHSSVFIGDVLYQFGGLDCLDCPSVVAHGAQQTVQYNIASNAASLVPLAGGSVPTEILGSCAVPLPDGTALLIGGVRIHPSVATLSPQLWRFDPKNKSQTFSPITNVTGTGPSPRWGISCSLGPDKRLAYVHGGCDPSGAASVDSGVYTLDFNTMAWTSIGSSGTGPSSRCFSAGAMINGYFVVHGGQKSAALNVAAPAAPVSVPTQPKPASVSPIPTSAQPNQPQPSIVPPRPLETRPPTSAPQRRPSPSPSSNPGRPQAPNLEPDVVSPPSAGRPSRPSRPSEVETESDSASSEEQSNPNPTSGQNPDWRVTRPSWWPDGLMFPPPGIDIAQSIPIPERLPWSERFLRRRQSVHEMMDDAGIWVFDTRSKAWTTPLALEGTARDATDSGPTIAEQQQIGPPNESSARTKLIIAAVFVSMIAAAVIFGLMMYYWWRNNGNRPSRSEMRQAAKRSGVARIFRVRMKRRNEPRTDRDAGSQATLLSTAPRDSQGGQYLDPDRNVVIPLLAPIHVDRGPFMEVGLNENKPLNPYNNMPQDLSTLSRNLGDISYMKLDRADGSALPARHESVFRKKTPQEMIEAGSSSQYTAHSVSEAVGVAVADAMHNLGSAAPAAPASSSSPTTTHSTTGFTLDQPLQYMVVYPHIPRLADEIELLPGDTIAVGKIYRDGWCRGTNLRTGLSGVFPLLAVEEAEDNASMNSLDNNAAASTNVDFGWWNDGGYFGEPASEPVAPQSPGYTSEFSAGGLAGNSLLLGGGTGDRGYGTVKKTVPQSPQLPAGPGSATSPDHPSPASGSTKASDVVSPTHSNQQKNLLHDEEHHDKAAAQSLL